MSDVPMKVVVDCSGSARPDPVELEAARDAAIEALRSGDLERAQTLTEAFDALASGSAVREVPLSEAEVAQREADRLAGLELAVAERRAQRDALLAASDWVVLPDSPVAGHEGWLEYRQSLRDLDYADPDVVWPEAP